MWIPLIPQPVFWGDLCFDLFPQELDPECKALMHRYMLSSFRWVFEISDALLPPHFCSKFDIIESIWVSFILGDENADFRSTLAILSVHFSHQQSGISRKIMHHISAAYALVNTKLSGPFSISDSAIAAVVSLAICQQIHHQPETGFAHLHGLCRMIELRGDFTRLMQENRPQALKPLSLLSLLVSIRLDVESAIQNGRPILFCRDTVLFHSTLCDPIISSDHLWVPPVMLDLFSFSRLLNEVERMQGKLLLNLKSSMAMCKCLADAHFSIYQNW
ncbi:hypothetical protein N7513_005426 [Penicillium frequentans]|nr:hypothetical protein N7513_005426 [Penicillium glabrum]